MHSPAPLTLILLYYYCQSRVLDIESEQFHQSDGSQHLPTLWIYAHNSIACAHYYLPYDVLGRVPHLEEAVLRDFWLFHTRFIVQIVPHLHF